MATLLLSDKLYANILNWLEFQDDPLKIYKLLSNEQDFLFLIDSLKKILANEKFVVLKNTPFRTMYHLEAFIRFFGNYYGCVEHTGIKVDCNYTGCATNNLVLHNDDAVDIDSQPNIGFIQVIKKDPLFKVKNGIVVIRELIRKLRYENPELLEKLLTTKVPMISKGINFDSENKKIIELKSNILYKENNEYKVRFDYDRIMYYYQYHKLKQSYEEGKMIYQFLMHCEDLKKNIFLDIGDILIHDNKATLHDRNECSIGIDVDQKLFTREIFVSFAL